MANCMNCRLLVPCKKGLACKEYNYIPEDWELEMSDCPDWLPKPEGE